MNQFAKGTVFLAVFFLASCVSLTVNVYFPAAEIKDAAEEIEGRVRSGQGAEGLGAGAFAYPPRRERASFAIAWGGRPAMAASDVDISIENPAIAALIESRAKRYKQMKPYLDNGVLGEDLDASLTFRDPGELDLKTRATVQKLVKEENADREKLYTEILRANGLDVAKENMERVRQLFAEAIREKMEVGHWYKKDKDTWVQKVKKENA